MDKNRDELLNDLIKYYDGVENESTTADESADDNTGDTRVIPASKPAPPEENLGDTVVMPIKKAVTADAEPLLDSTTAVKLPEQKPAEEPVEEVLGQMGLDGQPLSSFDSDEDTENGRSERLRHKDLEPVVFRSESDDEDDYADSRDNRSGIWYKLKPLWATLIVCVCLFAGVVLYAKGYVHTYIYNFTCNLEFICESLGIEYPFAEDVSVNPYPSVLSGETETEINSSEAGEGYTERNNVREETASVYDAVKEQKKLLPFEEAGSSDFSAYKNGVVCAKSNYICYMNSSGNTEWEYTTSVANPILSTGGDYIAIASEAGTHITLFKGSEFQYSTDTPNAIRTCKVSENGDVVVVTEKAAYKGAVVVINKKGEEVFSWASGVNYITSATPAKNRNIAITLADTASRVTSYIMMFDINSPDPTGSIELTESLIYDTAYSGKTIYATGDNSIVSVDTNSNLDYDIRFDDVSVTRSDCDHKGNRLVAFTINHVPAMNVYNKKGDVIFSEKIEATPDCVDIYETVILYNNGRDIICGDIRNERKTAYTAPMAVKNLVLLNNNTYVIVYEDTLEFLGY